jgi:ATP-dependent Clp protease ATP-binding subunit ClpA
MSTVDMCEKALFIFDEVDKTPPGVFDALVPFIHYPGEKFEGRNFKKSVFIFISNNGASDITRITFDAWKEGRRREDLTFSDFEKYLSNEAFNKKGSWKVFSLIDEADDDKHWTEIHYYYCI